MTTIIPWGIAYYEEVAATRIDVGGRCFRGVQKQSDELDQHWPNSASDLWHGNAALHCRGDSSLDAYLEGSALLLSLPLPLLLLLLLLLLLPAAGSVAVSGHFPTSHERSVQLVLNCKASLHLSPSYRRDKAFRV